MTTILTRLAPMTRERAESVASMLRQATMSDNLAIAIDDSGRPSNLVSVDDPRPARILGDLDVHA